MKVPESINRIVEDNTSGSVTLLNQLIITLENRLMDPELDPATFISWIEYVRNRMEMFAVIRHFCDELILSQNVSLRNDPANYLDFIRDYKKFWERAPRLLAMRLKHTFHLHHKTVMLHSNSGTISEVFRVLAGDITGIRFFQTLAAPAGEGKIQADKLAEMGYRITMITDALAAEMMRDTDYLILGADRFSGRTVINKSGSLQMALAARELNVPVIVLAESRKMSSYGVEHFRDQMRNPGEVLNDIRHPNIDAVNLYFEEIPLNLIDQIITEKSNSADIPGGK